MEEVLEQGNVGNGLGKKVLKLTSEDALVHAIMYTYIYHSFFIKITHSFGSFFYGV